MELSTVTVTTAEVAEFPARSVTVTRRSAGPFACDVVSHAVQYGGFESEPTPEPSTSKSTEATPEVSSEAEAPNVTVPDTVPLGPLTDAPGAVLSTILPSSCSVVSLPISSVITMRRSYAPSETPVVSQETLYGAASSEPIVFQSSSPAAEYSNATDSTPDSSSSTSAESVTVPRR